MDLLPQPMPANGSPLTSTFALLGIPFLPSFSSALFSLFLETMFGFRFVRRIQIFRPFIDAPSTTSIAAVMGFWIFQHIRCPRSGLAGWEFDAWSSAFRHRIFPYPHLPSPLPLPDQHHGVSCSLDGGVGDHVFFGNDVVRGMPTTYSCPSPWGPSLLTAMPFDVPWAGPRSQEHDPWAALKHHSPGPGGRAVSQEADGITAPAFPLQYTAVSSCLQSRKRSIPSPGDVAVWLLDVQIVSCCPAKQKRHRGRSSCRKVRWRDCAEIDAG